LAGTSRCIENFATQISSNILCLHLGFDGSLLCLQHLSDNLLFLNQKGSDNLFPYAAVTQATTISAVYFLLSQRHAFSFMSAGGSDTSEGSLAHTTLWDRPRFLFVLVDQFTSWGPYNAPLITSGVVGQPTTVRQSLNHFDVSLEPRYADTTRASDGLLLYTVANSPHLSTWDSSLVSPIWRIININH